MSVHGHGHGPGHGHGDPSFASTADADRLEREAEDLLADTEAAIVRIAASVSGDVARIVDVGCGPGVVTCLLAERFPGASVVAADSSPVMLTRVADRADRLGLADRVVTAAADLAHGLDALGLADVVWASMVLHHVDDVAAAVDRLRGLVRTGGVLAVVERESTALPTDGVIDDASLPSGRRLWLAGC